MVLTTRASCAIVDNSLIRDRYGRAGRMTDLRPAAEIAQTSRQPNNPFHLSRATGRHSMSGPPITACPSRDR